VKSDEIKASEPLASKLTGSRRAVVVVTVGLALVLALIATGIRSLAVDSGLGDPLVGTQLAANELHLLGVVPSSERIQIPVQGARILLHFWSPHCRPCLRMHGTISELAKLVSNRRDRAVFAVTADAVDDVREHLLAHAQRHAILWDPRGRLHGHLQVDSLPTDVIIDEKGVVVRLWRHPPTKSQLLAALVDP